MVKVSRPASRIGGDFRAKQRPPTSAEIGVALTTFGALFMLLGVMMFFDGSLLALGNVRARLISLCCYRSSKHDCTIASVPVWYYAHHRSPKDILLLCTKTKTTWHDLLLWRYPACILQVAVLWGDRRNDWFLEPLRVCAPVLLHYTSTYYTTYYTSDFFPVILTFLRQLPIIGNVLSMPYIREVITLFFFR